MNVLGIGVDDGRPVLLLDGEPVDPDEPLALPAGAFAEWMYGLAEAVGRESVRVGYEAGKAGRAMPGPLDELPPIASVVGERDADRTTYDASWGDGQALGTVEHGAAATEPGEPTVLSWVPESRVPEFHRRYVQRHVDRLATENGLPPVTVRWFGPFDGTAGFWGRFPEAGVIPAGVMPADMEDTIALHHGMRGADLVLAVIAHEIMHLIQRRDGRASDEAEADAFGAAYVARAA